MKRPLQYLFLTLFGTLAPTAFGDEDFDHFASLEAPNTTVAVCNLNRFNNKLQAIVEKAELSAEDMVKVHELTYTLENAVQRLQQNLVDIAVDLEKTHKASEALKQDDVRMAGNAYLDTLNLLLKPKKCD